MTDEQMEQAREEGRVLLERGAALIALAFVKFKAVDAVERPELKDVSLAEYVSDPGNLDSISEFVVKAAQDLN